MKHTKLDYILDETSYFRSRRETLSKWSSSSSLFQFTETDTIVIRNFLKRMYLGFIPRYSKILVSTYISLISVFISLFFGTTYVTYDLYYDFYTLKNSSFFGSFDKDSNSVFYISIFTFFLLFFTTPCVLYYSSSVNTEGLLITKTTWVPLLLSFFFQKDLWSKIYFSRVVHDSFSLTTVYGHTVRVPTVLYLNPEVVNQVH